MNAIDELGELLATPTPGVGIVIGTVTDVNTSDATVDVRLGGTGSNETPDTLPNLPRLASYSPAVGDIVVLLDDGDEQVVIGKLA